MKEIHSVLLKTGKLVHCIDFFAYVHKIRPSACYIHIYNDTNPKVFAVVDLVSAVKYLNHDRKQFNSPSAEGTLTLIII